MKKIDKNQKLYSSAKKIIPGGTMLFSKRPENHLPGKWPTYFKKAKGAYIWDLNNNKFLDMFFGVGQNVLGYANKKIDRKVNKENKLGNMSSLNCYQEVDLAKKLVSIHKWSGICRFAKTGGEANAIAVRIARSYAKKNVVAICGYHGWHDWYLAANLKSKKNLNYHLLKGLNPLGVPKELKNTIMTFKMNSFEDLKKIENNKKIGVIKMEIYREKPPNIKFLKRIRNFCNKNKIVLIFDECTSAFRESYGGLHLKYKIYPDLLMLGKAMGNGYPITAVLGKKKFLECASNTFISSTFWTEKSGIIAALETLKIMKNDKTYIKVKKTGIKIKKIWKNLSIKFNIPISINGLDSIPSFKFLGKDANKFKTYLTQEMIESNILATTSIYVSIEHNEKLLKKYEIELNKIFKKISMCQKGLMNINSVLKYKEASSDFTRLTK